MGRLKFPKGIFRHSSIVWALIFIPLVVYATVIPDNTTIVGTTTMQSGVTVSTSNGIDINPGSDTDADLLSVGVTGSPKLSWDESEDAFKFLNNLLLGTNASLTQTVHGSSIVSSIAIDQDSSGDPKGLSIISHNSSNPTGGNLSIYRSRGSYASPTIVQDNDIVSRIVGLGYDGGEWENAAEITFQIDGTPSTSAMPGEIVFKTTPSGSTTLSEAARINSNGAFGISKSTIDASLLFDIGSVNYGSRPAPPMNQTERDAITSPATGLMVYNTDFNKYNFYNGSAFESILTDIGTQEVSGKTITDSLKFKETGGGSNYTAFQAPSSLTGDVTFTLPDGDGSSGQVLSTNGSGTLSWATSSASSSTRNVTTIDNTDSPYTVLSDDQIVLCDTSSGSITVDLPAGASSSGRNLTFFKTSTSNTLTIDGNASETISGSTTRVVVSLLNIIGDGTNWREVNGVNEVLSSNSSSLSSYSITANQWGDLTSLSLTPGTWDIFAQSTFYSNGATTTGLIYMGIGTTSGNNQPGTGNTGVDFVVTTKRTTSLTADSLSHSLPAVTLSSTTTYYLKAYASSSTTNLQVGYKIWARRIQ